MTSALGWSCIFLHEAFWPLCLFWQCHQLRLQSVLGWSCIFLHGASLAPLPLLAMPPNCDLQSVIRIGVVEHLEQPDLLGEAARLRRHHDAAAVEALDREQLAVRYLYAGWGADPQPWEGHWRAGGWLRSGWGRCPGPNGAPCAVAVAGRAVGRCRCRGRPSSQPT